MRPAVIIDYIFIFSILRRNEAVNRWTEIQIHFCLHHLNLKGALAGLRQFLATESPLKIMKNAFHLTSKALFVLKIFKILPWHFGHVEKRLDYKKKVNFEIYDVTAWLINKCNTHIVQYLK